MENLDPETTALWRESVINPGVLSLPETQVDEVTEKLSRQAEQRAAQYQRNREQMMQRSRESYRRLRQAVIAASRSDK